MSRILIVGAGATGGFFGAHLARAHRDVTFLVRPARAASLKAEGLRLSTPQGNTVLTPRWVTAENLGGVFDIVLLSVKADALHAALDDLAPAVGETSVIVPFLNGTDHIDAIEQRFPGRLLGGVVKVVAQLTGDGTIKTSGPTATLEIGELTGGTSPRVRRTAEALDVDGYEVSVSDGIHTAMWHKWVFISMVTTVCCLATGTIGEVAATSGGDEFATAVLAETAAIAEAAGHPLSASGYEALRSTVTQADSPFAPSLYRDMIDNRPTEVESVLGAMSSVADRLGVPAPLVDLATLRLRLHNRRVAATAR